jgi:2-C-methyl-D-erythritol 2,4-cyclodiphosphate synthase
MIRIGTGFDIHRLAPGRRLVLCGAVFDSPVGLYGHSDADAPVHAVIDALLGAAALGDIGALFPDTAPEWKDADSLGLLRSATRFLRQKGWRPSNVDVTIIAEFPKISARVPEMRANLAAVLDLPVGNVSVKGKTMEQLGPVGRGEAIAAQAATVIEQCN